MIARTCIVTALVWVAASAQVPVPQPVSPGVVTDPVWRRNITGILGRRPTSVNVRDVQQFQQYLLAAAPYCTSLAPNDYEANRELARQMTAYVATMNALARDAETRAALVGLSRSIAAFPCAYPATAAQSNGTPQVAAPAPAEPPFSMQAPALENVPAADQETARDLTTRYETDAARAASTWKNAETMRISLAGRGMTLSAQTSASVARFQILFNNAADALREHRWDDARSSLQGVEAETQKVGQAVGR
jgi:hypothetical protein